MNVDIAGEDAVTQAILERIISDYRPDITITGKMPARGGQLKRFAPNYNKLGYPLILLTDLDNEECAPSLIASWLANEQISETMLFRVACDEAESWLMADREGFSKWLAIDLDLIPLSLPIKRRSSICELKFPYKPSLYMMTELVSKSKREELKSNLTPRNGASKGPGYNTAILPFIENVWNIKNAQKNSDSLKRAIVRIKAFKV